MYTLCFFMCCILTYCFFGVSETIQKFRCLRKNAQIVLMNSMEKAIWNWMDTYPNEFADLQVSVSLFKCNMIPRIKLWCSLLSLPFLQRLHFMVAQWLMSTTFLVYHLLLEILQVQLGDNPGELCALASIFPSSLEPSGPIHSCFFGSTATSLSRGTSWLSCSTSLICWGGWMPTLTLELFDFLYCEYFQWILSKSHQWLAYCILSINLGWCLFPTAVVLSNSSVPWVGDYSSGHNTTREAPLITVPL